MPTPTSATIYLPNGSTQSVGGDPSTFSAMATALGGSLTAPVAKPTATPTPGSPTGNVAPATEPSVLTSANIDQKNQQNTATLATKAAQPAGQALGEEGFVRNADQSFAEAPSGATQGNDGNGNNYWSHNGMNYAVGPMGGKVSSDPLTNSLYDQFSSLKASMDATGAANIEAIKQQFEGLIKQQTQANAGNEAATNSLLIRGGANQSASSGGIIQGQISYGLQQISDLVAKENSAVIAAQQAQQDGDYKLLDKQLEIASSASKDRQAAAQKLSDAIMTATKQARTESAIMGAMANGTSSPADILKNLQATGNTTISLKDINETISNLNPDQKDIHTMLLDASKNGAPDSVRKAIAASKSISDAISAAGQYVTDPTSTAGQFNAAVAGGYKGTPGDWIAAQKYKEAYAAASAKNAADAAYAGSDAGQNKLFQQGVSTLRTEMSSRSGGLGLQDAKVNQAIHLKSLFDQYATTVTVPNMMEGGVGVPAGGTHTETRYNIPRSQYTEIALGLANLLSPTGTVAEGTVNKIIQSTARGDINAALTWATGQPQNGSTQAVFQNLKDSIDRQGTVAEGERQTYINDLLLRLPPGLSETNLATLTKSAGLNSFTNPDPTTMTPAQIDTNAFSKIQDWAKDPNNAALLQELSKQFPDLSNVELAQKLKLIP